MKKIYEGKAKAVYETDDPEVLIQRFKDSATAFNAEKKAEFKGKGELNHRITTAVFRYLQDKGISTHYMETLNARDMKMRRVEIIPIEVVARNVAAGSLSKRIGFEEGTPLRKPIVEYYYKVDELGDPMIAPAHIDVLELATADELEAITEQALAINHHLREFWKKCGLTLVDFKIEFGRTSDGEILLADEISPDTQRLWTSTGEKRDKDVFRRDIADLMDTYRDVYARVIDAFPEYDLGELEDPGV
jgi:phosphoribosylaminoimidazole-succinocarboxamide synthase